MKRNSEKHLCPFFSCHGNSGFLRIFFFFFIFFIAALDSAGLIDPTISSRISAYKAIFSFAKTPEKLQEFPFQCFRGNHTQPHRRNYPPSRNPTNLRRPSNVACPSYFRWIHEDLRPWKETGITRVMIEKARKIAHFRVVILDGKVYAEKFRNVFQTRDVFTLWGILQLLRWYPGRLPDLEFVFECGDRTVVPYKDFRNSKTGPPPLFRYCSDAWSFDIVFPDWSFWGWPEINIKPWREVLTDIKEGNRRVKWKDRVPYAYWRGNPFVGSSRKDLLKCNVSNKADWNTRLYAQDWDKEIKQGFRQSGLEDQCAHRYKIYVEGLAWSVSEKYILACDSMSLLITPRFYDFFSRGLEPLQHYWPIRETKKCTSLKFAVEWGNNHTDKAEEIGKTASNFMQEDLKMEHVYDYMYHLLNEYGKLLRFKPTIPEGAVELCSENWTHPVTDTEKRFMMESKVESPNNASPCNMPPPHNLSDLRAVLDKRAKIVKQVEMWEDEYWKNQRKKTWEIGF